MSPYSFFQQERNKIIISLFASGFFLYFWINGPNESNSETFSIETLEGPFSKPILVEDDNRAITGYNTIEENVEEAYGYGIIQFNNEQHPSFGLLATEDRNPGLSRDLALNLLEHSKIYFPDTQTVKLLPSFDMYYALSGKEIGMRYLFLESEGVVKGVSGYAGPVQIGVVIAENGDIISVNHISSSETASYLESIQRAGFYENFRKIYFTGGKQKIDAVSGATITTEAIASTFSQLIEKATPYPLSDYIETGHSSQFSVEAVLSKTWILHLMVIFLIFFYGLQKSWRKTKRGILIIQILSVIYIGFFLNNSFTYVSFIHPFIGTSVSTLVGLYAFFCIMGAIWGKNTYCKYVCPFGNTQRLLLRMKLVEIRTFFIPHKWIYRTRGILTIVLISGVLLGLRTWSNYELFPDLFGFDIASFWLYLTVGIVVVNIRYPLIWCRLLCPTGSVLDVISDLSVKRLPKS